MRITILGGAGFLGRKLATRLAKDGALGGRAITGLTLFDLAAPATLAAPFPVTCLGGDVADHAAVAAAIPAGTEVVFHLNFPMTRFIIGTRKCQSQQLGFNYR